jgi:putative cardiolipin synthase
MKKKTASILPAVIAVIVLLFSGCARLPENSGRSTSFAIPPDESSPIYRDAAEKLDLEPDENGYLLLGNGLDAFVARAVLADLAVKSIDSQYYLLHDDVVGRLFVDRLLKAADRGVRVRLLVDDMDMAGRDIGSAVLDSHPNVEVRIFNPFGRNTGRLFQYLSGFNTLTRRSHNKSFTVDSIATIVGGRNIGDEYFVADPALAFLDLDVLAVGPAAAQVAWSFDLYWNHELSYPISLLIDAPPTPEQVKSKRAAHKEYIEQQRDTVYYHQLTESNLARALKGFRAELNQGKGRGEVVWDHPDKLLSHGDMPNPMLADLLPYLEGAEQELIIISPYFVPGKGGVDFFRRLRGRGVRVVIFTNSLSSTDVSVVHAGYAKYRHELLRMGVELYELNSDLRAGESSGKRKFHQSKTSLHAKCFVIDRSLTFIGSLNLDPRSVIQNTEIGMVIESELIAAKIASFVDRQIAGLAFKLELEPGYEGSSHIVWHGLVDGQQRTLKVEPHTGFWQRFMVGLMRLLPIESQL